MKYAFIALHRLQFSVRTMCRLPRGHPSGFYVWLKDSLSRRANEDRRQTDLPLKAWQESGKVYGHGYAISQDQRLAVGLWIGSSRTGGRLKKVAIVALARKLLIALWKFVTAGVVIEGAVMKTARRPYTDRTHKSSRTDQSWRIQVSEPPQSRAQMPRFRLVPFS